jgi:predicted thioesterase
MVHSMSTRQTLVPGIEGQAEVVAGPGNLASDLGSGFVDVYSTPMMIGLMETAAASSVQPFVGEGKTTVGVRVDIRHVAATPPGMRIIAHSRLVKLDGKALTFEVWAEDEHERIGEGVHERAIIDRTRFVQRVEAKAAG